MSLRTRLIIAFLLLSVVPLTAVTLFSYISSVSAVENAARRAATDDAADISRRMDIITADVGRRMDSIFDVGTTGSGAVPTAGDMHQRVAPALGDAAALVERFEFQPMEDPDPNFEPEAMAAQESTPPAVPETADCPEAAGLRESSALSETAHSTGHRRRRAAHDRTGAPRGPAARRFLARGRAFHRLRLPGRTLGGRSGHESGDGCLGGLAGGRRGRARDADAGARAPRRDCHKERGESSRQGKRHAEPGSSPGHGAPVRTPRPGRDPVRHRSPRRTLHAGGIAEVAAAVDTNRSSGSACRWRPSATRRRMAHRGARGRQRADVRNREAHGRPAA